MEVTNLGQAKVCVKIYGSLKMPFCYIWNFGFSRLRMTLTKKLFSAETLSRQFKFQSRVAFNNLYF